MRDYLAKQRKLQRLFGTDPVDLRGERRVEYVRMNVLAATDELHEALRGVNGWKAWQTERQEAGEFYDQPEYIDDLVDVLHFVGNLLLAAGVEDDALDYHFNRKQAKNRERQEKGYAGIGKEFDTLHGRELLERERDKYHHPQEAA